MDKIKGLLFPGFRVLDWHGHIPGDVLYLLSYGTVFKCFFPFSATTRFWEV
jgi:hypothetical protein